MVAKSRNFQNFFQFIFWFLSAFLKYGDRLIEKIRSNVGEATLKFDVNFQGLSLPFIREIRHVFHNREISSCRRPQ